jgi:hypothetical protein
MVTKTTAAKNRLHRRSLSPPPLPPPPPKSGRFPKNICLEGVDIGLQYKYLATVESSGYSCLLPRLYQSVRAILLAELPPGSVSSLVDATSNVGCDSLLFRDVYETAAIDAIELDPVTFACLQYNMMPAVLERVLQRRLDAAGTLHVHHESCVPFLTRLAAEHAQRDMVYFDPPWGGIEYQSRGLMQLALDGEPLGAIIGRVLRDVAPVVVLKAPVTTDIAELEAAMATVLGYAAPVRRYDIMKPRANAKGSVAYQLYFYRRDAA